MRTTSNGAVEVDEYQLCAPLLNRRLGTESVGMVMATRVAGGELGKLPRLAVAGLRTADAGTLLDTVLPAPVDARVRDQIVAETRGDPLALLELPRAG